MTDKKHKLSVKTKFVSEGMAWPIDVHFEVPITTPEQTRTTLKDLTGWLRVAGFRPNLAPEVQNGRQESARQNGEQMKQAEVTFAPGNNAAPECPAHMTPMKESGIQKKEGFNRWFCTSQEAGGYCRHRADVNIVSSQVTQWMVKK